MSSAFQSCIDPAASPSPRAAGAAPVPTFRNDVATGLFVMPCAFSTYESVDADSSTASCDGESVAMTTVLHRPPSDSCSSRVSFESRYGMRACEEKEKN